MPVNNMYYRVERAYLSARAAKTDPGVDLPAYLMPAANARDAVMIFVSSEQATLLGTISELPGDKAIATARIEERVCVVFAQRAAEAVPSPPPRRNEDVRS
jgi:hypothetical protein